MEATLDRRRGDPLMQRFCSTIGSASMLLAGYFLLNILLRAALPHSLELDEAEQTFYAQYLLAGYGPQPPFYNWMQYAVDAVAGPSIWALSIPKNVLLFLCYLFYGLAAREMLKDRTLQAAAMLALITLPQVSYMAQQDLTHTVALLFATSLFLFGFFRTLERPSLLSYLILGIATGVGIIAKYNFALMPLIAVAAVIPDREWRQRLLDWRILPAFAIALAITLPHLHWLYGNVDLASHGTLSKMIDSREASDLFPAGKGLLSLLIAIIAFAALPIAIFAAAFRRDFVHALSAGDGWTRLMERMIVISLIAVVAVILVTGATHIRERWLDPFLLILPIYIFRKLEVAGADLSLGLKRFLNVVPVLMALVLIALAARVTGAEFIGSYTKLNVPFADFAKAMTDKRQPPALIIASDRYVGGNLRLQLPDVPVIISGFPNPGIAMNAAAARPILVAWRGPNPKEAPMPPEISTWLKQNGLEPDAIGSLALPYHFGKSGDTYALGFAWLERK
ncbi:dolichyl-phosphate-mannose-protein mannosyltransferase [Rhizobium sullae]|uniref:Dolichyl-phosphate-mannose-protein mannosyltransferase n=1 Tax=Rhizobium sullae TaxID=50338 RepID=A0A4V2VA27_RHISU|nr:dolichyl-phosphate-mannose-protein mannosyltransferase [Rhizobium sullae]